MLIGGLGTALLFVSVGAGTTQDAPTTIQVTDDPFPYEITTVTDRNGRGHSVLLNRETGNLEQIETNLGNGLSRTLTTYKYQRNLIAR